MRRECQEHFPRRRGLAIPTCITARASRTCRDACRDRLLAVSVELGGGGDISGACAIRYFTYLVRGPCMNMLQALRYKPSGWTPLHPIYDNSTLYIYARRGSYIKPMPLEHLSNTKQMPLEHLSYTKEASWITSCRSWSRTEFAHGEKGIPWWFKRWKLPLHICSCFTDNYITIL